MAIKALIYRHLCGRTDVLLMDVKPGEGIPGAIRDHCPMPKEECIPGLVEGISASNPASGTYMMVCSAPLVQEMSCSEIAQLIQMELRRREGMKDVSYRSTRIDVAVGNGGQSHG